MGLLVRQMTWVVSLALLGMGVARAAAVPGSADGLTRAELDFEEVLSDLGLAGSAPLVGQDTVESRAERDLDASIADLGLSGSAPLVGLERLGRADVTDARRATGASAGSGAGGERSEVLQSCW